MRDVPYRIFVADLPEIKKTAGYYDFSEEVVIFTLSPSGNSYIFLMVLNLSDLVGRDFERYYVDLFSDRKKIFVPRSCGEDRFDLRIEGQKKFNDVLSQYINDYNSKIGFGVEEVLKGYLST